VEGQDSLWRTPERAMDEIVWVKLELHWRPQ
jgi:hypothetical protein